MITYNSKQGITMTSQKIDLSAIFLGMEETKIFQTSKTLLRKELEMRWQFHPNERSIG